MSHRLADYFVVVGFDHESELIVKTQQFNQPKSVQAAIDPNQ